jgi:uncharacterized repeat protein (TIGR01451 family)
MNNLPIEIHRASVFVIAALALLTVVSSASANGLSCGCGDLCVNETGWWRAGGDFNASGTPIQAAVDNATAGETICVQDGNYTENVDVNVDNLTIRSQNGSANCIVGPDSGFDIFWVTSDWVNITGFTAQEGDYGIYLDGVEHCTISDNNATNNHYGIVLESSPNNTLINNTANWNSYIGIYLDDSDNNTIQNNTCNENVGFGGGDGIYLDDSDNNTIQNNTCNDNDDHGIYLYAWDYYNIIQNNTCNSNSYGIYLDFSNNNTIQNNTCNDNDDHGIYLYDSDNNNIQNNTCNDNDDHGIYLERYNYYNTLQNNTCNDNDDNGIYLGYDNYYNTLQNNTCNDNELVGISLDSSHYNNLTGNIAHANGDSGIVLFRSQGNKLLDNLAAGHKYSDFGEESFDVLLLTGASWTSQGELSFRNYETLELPLTHNAGALTLRLSQHGHDSAYVDYVALKKGESLYEPATAVHLASGADICHKLFAPDYDVCDAWESTLELTWDSVPADTTLVMRAMEEDLGPGHGSPFYYPLLREGRTLSHTLVNDSGIVVDGVLDEWKEPTFRVFWKPDTPHPDGYTSGWLHADDQYVYAAVEVTGDNTPDEGDWGALFVMVNGKLREFRVAPTETTWGQIGFQYTSAVPYEHRIYEFAIPLSVLNAQIGDELHYGFGAYGTFASQYTGIGLLLSDNNNLTGNRVTDNEVGIYLRGASENTVTCNAVYKNMFGFLLEDGSENNTIAQNGIVANMIEDDEEEEEAINFMNVQDVAVNATNNYWGTTVSAEIAASIREDPGNVTYEPFLEAWPPCAPDVPLLEVSKTVWNGTAWVKEVSDAHLNDTFRFNCTITNIGAVNLTQLRFWDILDCSLVFTGNATLKNATGVVINDDIVLEGTYTFKPKVLHPDNLSWDPYHPLLTPPYEGFTELCPDTGHQRELWGWEDTNNDGRISACDQINLSGQGTLYSYHVENVPYTLNVTNNETGESMYLESLYDDYEALNLSSEWDIEYTKWFKVGWTEACCSGDCYRIDTWNDTDDDRKLSVNDTIQLWSPEIDDEDNLPWYTVTELTPDLVVSREWEIDDIVDPDGLLLEPGQSLTLEYNATDISCGYDYNTFVAKGLYEGNWTYSNEAFAFVRVPPRPAVETNLTVWNGTAWAKEVTVLVNDTLNFSWIVHNNGSCCELFLIKGTLTVGSDETEVDINKRLAPCTEANGPLEVPALECGTYTIWWNVSAECSETSDTVRARDTVTVTVACPALEVAKTVWNGTAWVKALDASINENVRFNCTITNTGNVNLTQLRFWDILDCSLVYAGNATMTIPSHGIETQPIDLETTPRLGHPYNYTFKQRVLHPLDPSWDPYTLDSYWCRYPHYYDEAKEDHCNVSFYELCPEFGKLHYLHGWDDTDNNSRVSACDQLWLQSYEEWYHVDSVPYTLNVTNANTGAISYFDSELDYEAVILSAPNGTAWLEVCSCKDRYSLDSWSDDSDGNLSANDTIWLRNLKTGELVHYTVNDVAVDVVVSFEWEIEYLLPSGSPPSGTSIIVAGPPIPGEVFVLEPNQTITIEYNATVVRCGVDNNTFHAKGNPEVAPADVWVYSNEDIVTITVPCPGGYASDSGGTIQELFYTDETIYATGSGFTPNSEVDIYITEDKHWVDGTPINSTIYRQQHNVTADGNGSIIGVEIWPNPDPGEYDIVYDTNNNMKFDLGVDAAHNENHPGIIVLGRAPREQLPALTPVGIAILIGLLSIITISTIVRQKKR